MSKIDDGGPAYPHKNPNWNVNGDRRPEIPGMSLRDWFAGQALNAILAATCKERLDLTFEEGDSIIETKVRDAFRYADAMLQARKEKEE